MKLSKNVNHINITFTMKINLDILQNKTYL